MAGPSGEWKRTVLWSAWVLNMLFNTVYVIMSFITCSKLVDSVNTLKGGVLSNATWRAPIAAASLGPCMVLLFNILSCFILIKKSVNRNGPGFGYGFIVAWCFVMAFFCLLCGLILESFSSTVAAYTATNVSFTSYSTSAYDATFYFAYFCAAFFVVFFICLVVFQGGISKQLGMFDEATDEKRRMELAAMQVGMQLAAQVPQQQRQTMGAAQGQGKRSPPPGTNNAGPQI